MTTESRARAQAQAKAMMVEMLLGEVRKAVGLTQEQLAESLGIKQSTLSRLESQEDIPLALVSMASFHEQLSFEPEHFFYGLAEDLGDS